MKVGIVNGAGAEEGEFPSASQLAALRAWYAGLSARAAVVQYLGESRATGQSSRAMLGEIRRRLASYARLRHRDDLASLIAHPRPSASNAPARSVMPSRSCGSCPCQRRW